MHKFKPTNLFSNIVDLDCNFMAKVHPLFCQISKILPAAPFNASFSLTSFSPVIICQVFHCLSIFTESFLIFTMFTPDFIEVSHYTKNKHKKGYAQGHKWVNPRAQIALQTSISIKGGNENFVTNQRAVWFYHTVKLSYYPPKMEFRSSINYSKWYNVCASNFI